MAAAPNTGYLVDLYTEADQAIESTIIQILSDRRNWEPSRLVNQVRRKYPQERRNVVNEAIWRLIDSGKIELTRDRKLRLP